MIPFGKVPISLVTFTPFSYSSVACLTNSKSILSPFTMIGAPGGYAHTFSAHIRPTLLSKSTVSTLKPLI